MPRTDLTVPPNWSEGHVSDKVASLVEEAFKAGSPEEALKKLELITEQAREVRRAQDSERGEKVDFPQVPELAGSDESR
jgi:hypothetical protein